jgi:hypothetical protein
MARHRHDIERRKRAAILVEREAVNLRRSGAGDVDDGGHQ